METREIFTLGRHEVDRFLSGITFYKEIEQRDPWQYELLLSKTKVYRFEPGEVIWRRGDPGFGFYFVSRGNLLDHSDVASNDDDTNNYSPIGPGEIVGEMAMFADNERVSTVSADKNCREVVLVATEFSRLGLDGVGPLDLVTKLSIYRMIVNSVRWKLELARMKSADSSIAKLLRHVPLFKGIKDTEEELACLKAQGDMLVKILLGWTGRSAEQSTAVNYREEAKPLTSLMT